MPDYVPLNPDPFSAHQLLLAAVGRASPVLDVGSSAGTLACVLAERGAAVDGIEYDPEAAAEAARCCRRMLVGDIEALDLDLEPGGYEVILMADIVEHLRDPVGVMRRMRPLLKPGGRLIVSTPNIANWSMRLLHLAGRWDYTERGFLDRTHLRFFTRRTLVRALADAGYLVERLDVTCPLPVLRREPFNRGAHWLAMRWKNLLAYQFIAVARAAPG